MRQSAAKRTVRQAVLRMPDIPACFPAISRRRCRMCPFPRYPAAVPDIPACFPAIPGGGAGRALFRDTRRRCRTCPFLQYPGGGAGYALFRDTRRRCRTCPFPRYRAVADFRVRHARARRFPARCPPARIFFYSIAQDAHDCKRLCRKTAKAPRLPESARIKGAAHGKDRKKP